MKSFIFIVMSLSWGLATAQPGRKSSAPIDYCKLEWDYQEKAGESYIGHESTDMKRLLTEEAPIELKLKDYEVKASLQRLSGGIASTPRYEIELTIKSGKISASRKDVANTKGVYSLKMLNGFERTSFQCQLGVVGE